MILLCCLIAIHRKDVHIAEKRQDRSEKPQEEYKARNVSFCALACYIYHLGCRYYMYDGEALFLRPDDLSFGTLARLGTAAAGLSRSTDTTLLRKVRLVGMRGIITRCTRGRLSTLCSRR